MLATLRRTIVDTWVGRLIALLFIVAFAGWGIADMLTNIFSTSSGFVARVGDEKIAPQDFDRAYQMTLRQVAQSRNTDPSTFDPQTRRQIAQQAVEQLVSQREVIHASERQGLRVPDSVLRDAVFAIPAFHGANGQFDHAVLDQRLRQFGMTEQTLLALLRADLAAQGLINAVQAGVTAPKILVDNAFAFGTATRTASYVTIPFPDPATIPAPDDATLHRYYDNHPNDFRSPEYRRIKAVVLTPDTIARDMKVSDDDVRRAYEMLSARYVLPERRSVEVLIGADQAKLAALADAWRKGASFADVQKQAGADASPVSLTDAPQSQFPSPELGRAVFAAPPQAVTGPVQTEGGWAVLRVGSVTPPHTTTLDQAKPDLTAQIARERAGAELQARETKLQDAIAGGGLDAVPTEIGAAPLLGSLDDKGVTPEGEPAPLPGPASLRQAIIAKAFATKPGVPPKLEQLGNDGAYALSVEAVTPAATRSFAQAHDAVLAAWRATEARRQANAQAAALYARAKGGSARRPGIAQAAADSGAGTPPVVQSPPIGRNVPPAGVPAALARIAFDIPVGQSTMVEDGKSFVVATITGEQTHPPSSDQLGYNQTRDALNRALGEDVGAAYVAWLRQHDRIEINSKLIDSMVSQP